MIVPYAEIPTHAGYEPEYRHVKSSIYNCSQQALWNLWLILKPKYILDIGTWGGSSAMLAAHYLDDCAPDGHVVTVDVQTKTGQRVGEHPLVTQVWAYPHTLLGLQPYPWASKDRLRLDYEQYITQSVRLNTALIQSALAIAGGELFDCAYIDGDHSRVGVRRDLAIVKAVTKPPHYALVDDAYSNWMGCAKEYRDAIRYEYNHYDFEEDGWENFVEPRPGVLGLPRCALVWEKE